MASSSTSHPLAAETRNWLQLPRDVTEMILHKVGAIEILESAQKVCMAWREISKDPAMWRIIDMPNLGDFSDFPYSLENMAMHAIDRSCGQLVDINMEYFGTDKLLHYIVERTSQLRRLRLVSCYDIMDDVFIEVAEGLPLLEELHIYYTPLSKESFEAVGRCCPLLKSLSYTSKGYRTKQIEEEADDEALVIAGNMPELRHLQLFGLRMTNVGLQAILDGCPHLESLDLRQCFNLDLKGDLGKGLDKRIKDLRLPDDSTEGYGFNTDIYETKSYGDECPSLLSYSDYFDHDDYYDGSDFDYDDFTIPDGGSDFSDFAELFFS